METTESNPTEEAPELNELAAIDIGTTSIRMAVARPLPDGSFQLIDSLHRDVNLGRDTFAHGRIRKETVAECVVALQQFSELLKEYGLTDPSRIRAVATSAVREASNRVAFLDRLLIATGFQVEIAEEADVSRLLYYAIEPLLAKANPLGEGDTVVMEIAGGSSEILHLYKGRVQFSHTYRLGSYRMRQMLDSYQAPVASQLGLIESQVHRTLEQLDLDLALRGDTSPDMLLMGGEARFVAQQLGHSLESGSMVKVSVSDWEKITNKVLKLSVEDIVETYHVTYPSAEALSPALISYLLLARYFKARNLYITRQTMRDGLLKEMRQGGVFSQDIRDHILQASMDLGRKYHFHEGHAGYVADLCSGIFDATRDHHQLTDRFGFLLRIAALLHEVGYFISNQSHHKHSMYLILNSEIFGLGARDLLLVALIARYHRRAEPKEGHEGYSTLDREDRIVVTKLASILRVADALDRSHSQRKLNFSFEAKGGTFSIFARKARDLTLEQIAINEKGSLFEQVYGLQPVIKKYRT